MTKVILKPKERAAFKGLVRKSFRKMTRAQKQAFLKLGAKDFSSRFAETFKKLANE